MFDLLFPDEKLPEQLGFDVKTDDPVTLWFEESALFVSVEGEIPHRHQLNISKAIRHIIGVNAVNLCRENTWSVTFTRAALIEETKGKIRREVLRHLEWIQAQPVLF